MTEPTYSLDELAERADTPSRTIRYYIQRGLVSRPFGEKRGAYYTAQHLDELLQIRKWVQAGVSLERIGALLKGEASPELPAALAQDARLKAHFVIAPGIELVIDASASPLSPAETEALIAVLQQQLGRRTP